MRSKEDHESMIRGSLDFHDNEGSEDELGGEEDVLVAEAPSSKRKSMALPLLLLVLHQFPFF